MTDRQSNRPLDMKAEESIAAEMAAVRWERPKCEKVDTACRPELAVRLAAIWNE